MSLQLAEKISAQFQRPEVADKFFWAELVFSKKIRDEFSGVFPDQIQTFVTSECDAQHFSYAETHENIVVTVATDTPEESIRDGIITGVDTLRGKYGCTLRDFHVIENLEDFWGEYSFAEPNFEETSALDRRTRIQMLEGEILRISHHVQKLKWLQQFLKEHESEIDPAWYQTEQMLLERQQQEFSLIVEHQQQLLEQSILGSTIADATTIALPHISQPILPIIGQQKELEWHDVDDPEELIPSIFSHVKDILYHPVLQSSLRKVVSNPRESYGIELIKVLSDKKEVLLFFKTVREQLINIHSSCPITHEQLRRIVKGISETLYYIHQTKGDDLFSDDLLGMTLDQDINTEVTLVLPNEIVNMISLLAKKKSRGTGTEISDQVEELKTAFVKILSSDTKNCSTEILKVEEDAVLKILKNEGIDTTLSVGKKDEHGTVTDIKKIGLQEVEEVIYDSGKKRYVIQTEGAVRDIIIEGEDVLKIEPIEKTYVFRVTLSSGRELIRHKDFREAEMKNGDIIIDALCVQYPIGYYLFWKTEKGWFDKEEKPTSGNVIAFKNSGYEEGITLVSLEKRKIKRLKEKDINPSILSFRDKEIHTEANGVYISYLVFVGKSKEKKKTAFFDADLSRSDR